MAIINYTDQLKYAGKGYLDSKLMPVNTVDDLKSFPLTQRFEGFTVTVLNNGNPQEYWLVGGITNKNWVQKTNGGKYSDLKLILENGFLKLVDGENQLGESIDLNNFFPENPSEPSAPSNDLYISSVDYVTENENGVKGIFMCFTYSDNSKKYLDMSDFLSNTYESGNGIVIDGNVISIDSAIIGKIEKLEEDLNQVSKQVETNKIDIESLKARLNNLNCTPDGETIGITDGDKKQLYVKILGKEGNLIKKDTDENGNSGLYASIPIFCEDDEI